MTSSIACRGARLLKISFNFLMCRIQNWMGNRGTIGQLLRHEEMANTQEEAGSFIFHLQGLKWRWPHAWCRIGPLVIERRKRPTCGPSKNAKGLPPAGESQ